MHTVARRIIIISIASRSSTANNNNNKKNLCPDIYIIFNQLISNASADCEREMDPPRVWQRALLYLELSRLGEVWVRVCTPSYPKWKLWSRSVLETRRNAAKRCRRFFDGVQSASKRWTVAPSLMRLPAGRWGISLLVSDCRPPSHWLSLSLTVSHPWEINNISSLSLSLSPSLCT